jgi:eukaryotic-like serine/threonine-protein kinase
VHRDVKPANLLLDRDANVHITDFGIASTSGVDTLTLPGTVLGTAGYLSPEQARGEPATAASDRYALGVVAFELMTGERPFAAESATAEAAAHVHADVPTISDRGDVPPELDSVFRHALAKDPAHRYGSCVDFVSALREALAAAAGTTRQLAAVRQEEYVAAPAPGREGGRPNTVLWAALGLLALLAIGGGLALASVLGGDEEPQARTVVEERTITGENRTVTQNVTTTVQAEPPPPPPPPTTATTATTAPTTTAAASGNPVELTDQATALLRQGRWAEAEAVARQAVAGLDGSGELYEAYAKYNLGRALVEQGRCDEALPLLDQSEQIQGSRREIRDARRRCR